MLRRGQFLKFVWMRLRIKTINMHSYFQSGAWHMRYAIYYLPPADSALWRFGCSVIGYDSSNGRDVEACVPDFDMKPLTSEPTRYGFHATLKAPFRLLEALSEADLIKAIASFARDQAPVLVGCLELKCIAGFIALAPKAQHSRLDEFAALCVQKFDVFRAPMSDDERRRRMSGALTSRQQTYLDLWGYPYVLEEFRFHMTLTDRLPEDVSELLRQALCRLYAPIDIPHVIEEISLCVQSQPNERFREIARFTLGSAA
jgi:putative phosphonate metabolism protein